MKRLNGKGRAFLIHRHATLLPACIQSWGPKDGSGRLAEGPMLARAAEGVMQITGLGASTRVRRALTPQRQTEKAFAERRATVSVDHRSRKACGQRPEHTHCPPLDQILLYRLIPSAEHVRRRNSHICCTIPCLRTLRAGRSVTPSACWYFSHPHHPFIQREVSDTSGNRIVSVGKRNARAG